MGPAAKLCWILKNGKWLATHNLKKPASSYTAGTGECLLNSTIPPPDFGLESTARPQWCDYTWQITQTAGQLNLNKSLSSDNINPTILRNSWNLVLPLFTKICQDCFKLRTIPLAGEGLGWCSSLKKDDKTLTVSEHIVHLKLLEKVILWHLLSLTSVLEPLNINQHAYRAGSFTDSALHALVSKIEESFSRGKFALRIFLDIHGTFDSVMIPFWVPFVVRLLWRGLY